MSLIETECPGCVQEQRATGSFITNAKGDCVLPEDTLEREITIRLNAKHKGYSNFILKLHKLLEEGKKESDLIKYQG